jgi:hypothetical protein
MSKDWSSKICPKCSSEILDAYGLYEMHVLCCYPVESLTMSKTLNKIFEEQYMADALEVDDDATIRGRMALSRIAFLAGAAAMAELFAAGHGVAVTRAPNKYEITHGKGDQLIHEIVSAYSATEALELWRYNGGLNDRDSPLRGIRVCE